MKATLFLFTLLLLLGAGTYAQSIKMNLAGVTAAGGENVVAVEYKITNSATTNAGGGGGSGKVTLGVFKVKKEIGASTNELFKTVVNGKHYQLMSFDYYDNAGKVYYSIVLKDIIVTEFDYLTPECAGCTKLSHQLSIDYSRVEMTDVAAGTSVKYDKTTNSFYQ